MSMNSEMTIVCRQCGKQFVFSKSEQEFYRLKGFVAPLHCKSCRIERKVQTSPVCSTCGLEIPKGGPVYCACCSNAVHLGYELELGKIKRTLEESLMKLNTLEIEKSRQVDEHNARLEVLKCEKARLSEQLQQKELAASALELQIGKVKLELEKSLRFHATLEHLEPAILELEKRLRAIECAQNDLVDRISRLLRKTEKTHQDYSLLEILRRLFRPQNHSPSLNQ